MFLVLLAGFEPRSLNLESSALPIESPCHPVMMRLGVTEGEKQQFYCNNIHSVMKTLVDWVTGWLIERQTRDPKTGGLNPACVRSIRKVYESFSFQKMLCLLAVSVPNPLCVHARIRMITYAR